MILAVMLILQSLTTAGLAWLLFAGNHQQQSAVCGHASPANDLGDTHRCVLPRGHDGSHANTFASTDESLHGYFWRDVSFLLERPASEDEAGRAA